MTMINCVVAVVVVWVDGWVNKKPDFEVAVVEFVCFICLLSVQPWRQRSINLNELLMLTIN